ncbi:MAG: 50S ribosomal protein L28 [Bdellovibrionales bacterium]|nr:50S ribosomal protein L28 [Bdellovibrionales bacterium]
MSGVSSQYGNRVSHAKNRSKHRWQANIQPRKIFIPEENRHVRVNVSTRVIRTIDKIGFAATLKKYGLSTANFK